MSQPTSSSRRPTVFRPTSLRARLTAVLALSLALPAFAGSALAADPAPFDGAVTTDQPIAGRAYVPTPTPSPRIVGGTGIASTDAPWQVFLTSHRGSSVYSCGGAILAADRIITAAHCVHGVLGSAPLTAGGIRVTAGAADVASIVGSAAVDNLTPGPGQQVAKAVTIVEHPYYNPDPAAVGATGDLAILTISPAFNLASSPTIKSIALPQPWTPTSSLVPVPAQLQVTGFGVNVPQAAGQTNGTTDYKLHALATAPLDPDACGTDFGAFSENAISICAHSPGGSSCYGDSGGPLVTVGANPTLIGIVSNGVECGANTDDIYVNLLAPENRAFIDNPAAAPPRAPRGLTDPTLTGPATFRVGDAITCNPGTFANAPSEVRIEFTKDDGTVLQSTVGASATLVLPATAVGSHLTCRAFAANSGGTFAGTRFRSNLTVSPAPSCPLLKESKYKWLKVKVKAPSSARRGRTFKVKVTISGLPTEAYTLATSIGGPGAKTKNTWVDMGAGNDAVVGRLPAKLKSSARVGRSYRLHVYIWQATNSDELDAARACAVGSKTFTVRAKR